MGRCPLAIPLAVLIAIILISDSLGFNKPEEPPFIGRAVCSAKVLSVRETATLGRLAVVEIDSMNYLPVAPFKAGVHILSEEPDVSTGQNIGFCTEIEPIKPLPAIPDIVDLQAKLRRHGVTASAVLPGDSIRYVADTPGLQAAMQRANEAVRSRLHALPLSSLSIEMLSAMILGRGEYLTEDNRDMFSAAGLSHLLALSGMHVGIIAMIISVMLWPLYFSRHVKSRLILTALALWAYAAFTGFMPSVTRAVIMASVYMLARLLQRRSVPMNSLCLAALVILMVRPSELHDVGFQLSFAAVAGIIMFFPIINRVNRRNHPWLYRAVSYPALSVSAMMLSGLVSAFHFHTFPLMFIVGNLLVAPLIPLFICSGLISVAFSITGPTDWLASAIEWVARFTASLPCSQIRGLYPSALFVLAVIAALTLLAWAIHARKRFWTIEAVILLAGILIISALRPARVYPEGETFVVTESGKRVHMIQRQSGQCLFFTNARLDAERREAHERYSLLLRDYMARRGCDSLLLMPRNCVPFTIVRGDTFTVVLDSCTAGRIACAPLH